MAEVFYRRMVDLLKLTLNRINVNLDFEVVIIDFYNNYNTYTSFPNDFPISEEEKDSISQVVKIPSPSMRNRTGFREILSEIDSGGLSEETLKNTTDIPLSLVLIRYPLSIYDSIPNYQIWASIDSWNPVYKYHTLLDFTLIDFLTECRNHFPNPNFELAIQRAGEFYLHFMIPRISVEYRKEFTKKITESHDQDLIRMIDAQNLLLHSDLNMISFQKYETEAIASEYIIASYDVIERLPLRIKFKNPVPIRDYKLIRKLLQISSPQKTMLIGTVSHAFGFIGTDDPDLWERDDYKRRPDFLSIRFFGVSHWTVSKLHHGERIGLMESKSFRYQYLKPRYSTDDLRKAFIQFAEYAEDVLLDIVDSAINEKHGTMLVITPNAKRETDRLSDCCIPIEPKPYLSLQMNVTAIDGAVLCDPFGICHAIGLILDGVHENGNGETISRGARHNSAKRYSTWQTGPCVIIIVSEDGDITIVSPGM